jgi:UDP-3-O-[3-hydroxymyristoyl] glucosamine N-acyltransferase
MKADAIASLLDAVLEGDGNVDITGAATLDKAGEADLAFLESSRGAANAAESQAGCLIAPSDFAGPTKSRGIIRVAKPRNAFAKALTALASPSRPAPGVHPDSTVAASARLADGVSIGPRAVVGENVAIGANTVVHAGAVVGDGAILGAACILYFGVNIYPGARIGDRCILHAGCVIGADGFGFVFEGGAYQKFPQIGGVVLGDDVEVGASSCIDRGALGDTVIGNGVKLDNLVHIGHNCRLGNHVVIAAQTGLSGGVIVEDYVTMAGQVGIGDKAHIGTKVVLGGQAGVLPSRHVAPNQAYWGTPARGHREYLRKLGHLDRLPEALAELKELRKRVQELEGR